MTEDTDGDVTQARAKAKTIVLQSVQFDRTAACRCGRRVRWARTAAGKNIPLEERARVERLATGGFSVSTDDVHWAHCKNAGQFRSDSNTRPSERID